MSIINISGYQFLKLSNLATLKAQLLDECNSLELKGTILLSQEGININLAGLSKNIDLFRAFLANHPILHQLTFRASHSAFVPFKKLKIQIKREIITMRAQDIDPVKQRAPEISPHDLKQWLDEQRDVQLLDTRNAFEVSFGTFNNALNPQIDKFSEFVKVTEKLDKNKPVVMFCTGGIRCEKAGLQLMQNGFEQVYQLHHGILNYFQEVGNAHFAGECYVFDERISVNEKLAVTGTQQCKQCQGPIYSSEQHDCRKTLEACNREA